MVSLTLTSTDERALNEGAKRLSSEMIEKLKGEYSDLPFTVFGPFEAQVYKVNDKFRLKMVVKCRLTAKSRRLFRELLSTFALDRRVTLAVNLNPLTV